MPRGLSWWPTSGLVRTGSPALASQSIAAILQPQACSPRNYQKDAIIMASRSVHQQLIRKFPSPLLSFPSKIHSPATLIRTSPPSGILHSNQRPFHFTTNNAFNFKPIRLYNTRTDKTKSKPEKPEKRSNEAETVVPNTQNATTTTRQSNLPQRTDSKDENESITASMSKYLHLPHRPSKEELLAAATGFWQRLKVRLKWVSIRSMRPWNADEWGAFVSWFLFGHIVWVLVGTTTFFSLLIFSINTVFAQGIYIHYPI